MRIKVKAATAGEPFEIHYIDTDEAVNVDTFLNRLVMDKIIHVNGMHDYMCNGYKINDLKTEQLKNLFNSKSKLKLESPAITLTLTLKQERPDSTHHWLLDYSEFVKMSHYYYDTSESNDIEVGTVFFIQHDFDQVLVKYKRSQLEFFYMKSSFKEVLEQPPDVKICFKSRDNLSKDELRWMRSISFPDRLPKNPVLESADIKSQQDVDEISVLIHRIITIIGRFTRAAQPLKKSGTDYPAYVQVGEETTIGYVNWEQLEKLK